MNRLIKTLWLTALVAVFLLLMNVEAAAAPADDIDKLEAFIDGVIYSQTGTCLLMCSVTLSSLSR